jgi:hypothetical protein
MTDASGRGDVTTGTYERRTRPGCRCLYATVTTDGDGPGLIRLAGVLGDPFAGA